MDFRMCGIIIGNFQACCGAFALSATIGKHAYKGNLWVKCKVNIYSTLMMKSSPYWEGSMGTTADLAPFFVQVSLISHSLQWVTVLSKVLCKSTEAMTAQIIKTKIYKEIIFEIIQHSLARLIILRNQSNSFCWILLYVPL